MTDQQGNKKNNNKNNKTKPKKGDKRPSGKGKEEADSKPEKKEEKTEVRPKIAQTLTAAIGGFSHAVDPDGELIHFAKGLGFPTAPIPGWKDPNPAGHPVTHMCRTQAIVQVVADAAGALDTNELIVLDWYGRNLKLRLPAHAEGVSVTIVPVRPETFAADEARAPLRVIDLPALPHVAMLVDIYQGGKESKAITPQSVADVAHLTVGRTCYLIAHDLREHCGADVFKATKVVGDTVTELASREGSWESAGVGGTLRSFKPDKNTPPYPAHPVPGWLHTSSHLVHVDGGAMWLHVHPMATVGPYMITKCVLAASKPSAVLPVVLPALRYAPVPMQIGGRVGQALTDAAQAVADMIPGLTVMCKLDSAVAGTGFIMHHEVALIDAEALDRVLRLLAHKPLNGRVLQTLMAEANAAVSSGGVGPVIQRYPGLSFALQFNTVLYACLSRPDLSGTVRMAESIADDEASGAVTARETVGKGKSPPAHSGPRGWAIGALLGAAGLAAAYWMWRRGRVRPSGGPLGYLRALISGRVPAPPHSPPMFDSYKNTLEMYREIPAEQSFIDTPIAQMLHTKGHYVGTAIEELLKLAFPKVAGVGLAVTEGMPYVYSGMSWRELLEMRGTGTLLHLGTSAAYSMFGWRALPVTIPLHWLHNWGVSWAFTRGYMGRGAMAWNEELFELWRMCWSRGIDLADKGIAECVFKMRAFPATADFQGKMLDWRARFLEVIHAGRKAWPLHWTETEVLSMQAQLGLGDCSCCHAPVIGEECASCTVAPATSFSFPLLVTSGHLYQPERSTWGTLVASAARDYVDPYGYYLDIDTEAKSMKRIAGWLIGAQGKLQEIVTMEALLLPLATREECVAALGGYKGLAFDGAWSDADLRGVVPRTATQMKHNETLKAARIGVTGHVEVKPRSIKNVHTTLQTHILPVARMLAITLKGIFDGSKVFQIGGYDVRIVIAHATPSNMQQYAALLKCPEVVIIVSCDDTIVSTGRYAAKVGFAVQETDYESFDQSQSRPFWEGDERILYKVWDQPSWWRLHEDINTAPVKGRGQSPHPGGRRDEILALLRMCMRTGVGTTSDFGSLHNLQAHVAWLMRGLDVPFERICADIGLVAKIQHHPTSDGATFLKGFFWKETWSMLPSACLKLGKMMRDPALLLKQEPGTAAVTMFAAVMSSVDVPADFPLLGAMRTLALRLVRAEDAAIAAKAQRLMSDPAVNENARYKVLTARASRADCLEFMLSRYGLLPGDIAEAEALILNVSSLPALVAHPVFVQLRAVDYN